MNAGHKWMQLLLDVLDYELEDGPLLSEGADGLVDKYPILGRALIIAAGSAITLHLANLVDPRFDIINPQFWHRVKGR